MCDTTVLNSRQVLALKVNLVDARVRLCTRRAGKAVFGAVLAQAPQAEDVHAGLGARPAPSPSQGLLAHVTGAVRNDCRYCLCHWEERRGVMMLIGALTQSLCGCF
jgi:hypothetical protein